MRIGEINLQPLSDGTFIARPRYFGPRRPTGTTSSPGPASWSPTSGPADAGTPDPPTALPLAGNGRVARDAASAIMFVGGMNSGPGSPPVGPGVDG
jgi:hypothetical protein